MPAVRKLSGDAPYIIEAYRNGSNIRQLAAAYGVAPGTIRNLLIRHKEPMRKQGRPKKAKKAEAEAAQGWKASDENSLPPAGNVCGKVGDSNESV